MKFRHSTVQYLAAMRQCKIVATSVACAQLSVTACFYVCLHIFFLKSVNVGFFSLFLCFFFTFLPFRLSVLARICRFG